MITLPATVPSGWPKVRSGLPDNTITPPCSEALIGLSVAGRQAGFSGGKHSRNWVMAALVPARSSARSDSEQVVR